MSCSLGGGAEGRRRRVDPGTPRRRKAGPTGGGHWHDVGPRRSSDPDGGAASVREAHGPGAISMEFARAPRGLNGAGSHGATEETEEICAIPSGSSAALCETFLFEIP